MLLNQAIIEVLKRHSSKAKTAYTGPLNRADILTYLKKDFPELDRYDPITAPKVRKALDKMIESEDSLPENDRIIHYTAAERQDGSMYKSHYWTTRSISDLELKFLVDSVLSSRIFNSVAAQDFARRIQQLSGKNLYEMTAYATGDLFGKQRFTLDTKVLKNLEFIMDADKKNCFINFNLNVYDVIDGKTIGMKVRNNYTVKPIHIFLNDGRYFMLARYQHGTKIYTFSVDLMDKMVLRPDIQDDIDGNKNKDYFNRAKYLLNHPYNMGGNVNNYKLRVNREYFSRVMDAFSYEIRVIPGTVTDTTVDIRVGSSLEGMKRWLLINYDIAELIDSDLELNKIMEEATEILLKKYKKM